MRITNKKPRKPSVNGDQFDVLEIDADEKALGKEAVASGKWGKRGCLLALG